MDAKHDSKEPGPDLNTSEMIYSMEHTYEFTPGQSGLSFGGDGRVDNADSAALSDEDEELSGFGRRGSVGRYACSPSVTRAQPI